MRFVGLTLVCAAAWALWDLWALCDRGAGGSATSAPALTRAADSATAEERSSGLSPAESPSGGGRDEALGAPGLRLPPRQPSPSAAEGEDGAKLDSRARPSISVEVIDADAAPDAQRPWVGIIEADRFLPEHLGRSAGGFRVPDTRIEGRDVFSDVAPGDWVVFTWRRPYDRLASPDAHARVTVTDGTGEARCRLELPLRDPTDFLTVTCLGPSGEPLAGVRFQVRHESESGFSASSLGSVEALRDGKYRLPARDLAPREGQFRGSPNVTSELTGQSELFGAASIPLEVGALARTLRFDHPGALHVEVIGYEEGTYTLTARPPGRTHWEALKSKSHEHEVDPLGHATFSPLAPGTYIVALLAPREEPSEFGRLSRKQLTSVEVTVGPGDNHLRLAMPELYQVRIEAPKLGEGVTVRLQQLGVASFGGFNAETDEHGIATIEDVPGGVFDIAADGGYMTERVTVPPTLLVYGAKEIRAMSLTLKDEQGLLYAAGFRDGDVVIGAEGVEFANSMEFGAAYKRMAESTVDWLVERGGAKTVIRAGDYGDIQTMYQRLGGAWTPIAR